MKNINKNKHGDLKHRGKLETVQRDFMPTRLSPVLPIVLNLSGIYDQAYCPLISLSLNLLPIFHRACSVARMAASQHST